MSARRTPRTRKLAPVLRVPATDDNDAAVATETGDILLTEDGVELVVEES